jgi:hypothetical protein
VSEEYWRETGLTRNPHPTLGEQIAEGMEFMAECRRWQPSFDALEAEQDDLRAEIARLREAARWIPCSERVPDVWDEVLALTAAGRVHGGYRSYDGRWCLNHIDIPGDEVTHWRPLPEPPEVTP